MHIILLVVQIMRNAAAPRGNSTVCSGAFCISILFSPSRSRSSLVDYDGQCIFLFQSRRLPNGVQIVESNGLKTMWLWAF